MKEKDFHKQVTIGFSLLELLMLLSGIALLCGTVLLIRKVGSEMVIESGLVPVSIVSILYLSGQAILLILVFVQIHQLKKNLLRGELFDSENPRIFHRCSLYCYGVILFHLLCGIAGLLLQQPLLRQIQDTNPFFSEVSYFVGKYQVTFNFDMSLILWIAFGLLLDCFSFIYKKAIEAYRENELTF